MGPHVGDPWMGRLSLMGAHVGDPWMGRLSLMEPHVGDPWMGRLSLMGPHVENPWMGIRFFVNHTAVSPAHRPLVQVFKPLLVGIGPHFEETISLSGSSTFEAAIKTRRDQKRILKPNQRRQWQGHNILSSSTRESFRVPQSLWCLLLSSVRFCVYAYPALYVCFSVSACVINTWMNMLVCGCGYMVTFNSDLKTSEWNHSEVKFFLHVYM